MEKLQVGDRVKFINEVGGGIVEKILDNQTVSVLTDDGFAFPVNVLELLRVERKKEKRSADTKQTNTVEGAENQDSMPETHIISCDDLQLIFALCPVDKDKVLSCDMELHLINDCSVEASFVVYHKKAGHFYLLVSGNIEAGTKICLDTKTREELLTNPVFFVHAFFIPSKFESGRLFVDHELSVQPITLLDKKSYVDSDFFDTKVVLFPLAVYREQSLDRSWKTEKKITLTPCRKIDISISSLVEDAGSLRDQDKRDIQLLHIEKILEQEKSKRGYLQIETDWYESDTEENIRMIIEKLKIKASLQQIKTENEEKKIFYLKFL